MINKVWFESDEIHLQYIQEVIDFIHREVVCQEGNLSTIEFSHTIGFDKFRIRYNIWHYKTGFKITSQDWCEVVEDD